MALAYLLVAIATFLGPCVKAQPHLITRPVPEFGLRGDDPVGYAFYADDFEFHRNDTTTWTLVLMDLTTDPLSGDPAAGGIVNPTTLEELADDAAFLAVGRVHFIAQFLGLDDDGKLVGITTKASAVRVAADLLEVDVPAMDDAKFDSVQQSHDKYFDRLFRSLNKTGSTSSLLLTPLAWYPTPAVTVVDDGANATTPAATTLAPGQDNVTSVAGRKLLWTAPVYYVPCSSWGSQWGPYGDRWGNIQGWDLCTSELQPFWCAGFSCQPLLEAMCEPRQDPWGNGQRQCSGGLPGGNLGCGEWWENPRGCAYYCGWGGDRKLWIPEFKCCTLWHDCMFWSWHGQASWCHANWGSDGHDSMGRDGMWYTLRVGWGHWQRDIMCDPRPQAGKNKN